MINNLLEEKECCLSFSNFRTKQDVQKRKLGVELVKREWKVCSAGFRDDIDNKRKKRNASKFVTFDRNYDKELPPRLVSQSRTDLLSPEAELVVAKADCQLLKNLDDSSIEEKTLKQRNGSSKRSNSVFLEVQNIQSSFQRKKFDDNPKPLVKLPSEFTKTFKEELLSNHVKKQKKSNLTLYPMVRHHEEVENKHKFQNYEGRANTCFQSSKTALCDFKINADLPSKLADNAADIQGSIVDNNCMKVTEFTRKLKEELSSKGLKRQNLQISENYDVSPKNKPCFKLFVPLTKSLKADQQLQNFREVENKCNAVLSDNQKENAKSSAPFDFQIKNNLITNSVDNVQRTQKSFLDNKSIDIFTECSKKLMTDLVFKKKSLKQDVFQNSFGEDKLNAKPPDVLSFKAAEKLKTCLLLKKNEEQESVPKKLKMDQSTFIAPSADFSQSNETFKVKKINIPNTFPINSEKAALVKKASNGSSTFVTILEASPAITTSIQLNDFVVENERSFQASSSRSEISSVEFSKLLDSRSVGSKGSNWMQSLKPAFSEENEAADHDGPVLKKRIRNIVPGGFAEQLLKLQRRESTEKAIWNHKIHQNTRKALKTSLCFILTSISFVEELVIAKAASTSQDEFQTETDGKDQISLQRDNVNQDESKDLKIVFILFKRKAFTRMRLKLNDVFRLHQPWQTLHLKSIPHPIILCAYFIDVISQYCQDIPNEVVAAENISTLTSTSESESLLKRNIQPEDATHGDMLFYKREELVTFSARIQRVWKKEFVTNTSSPAFASKYVRFSILLQVKEGTFHELRILPDAVPYHWSDVICQGEGKCFRFHNLCVAHRTPLKRDKYLKKILEAMQQQNGRELMQDFCYQLMFDGSSTIPEEIRENGFPDYCPISIVPLHLGLKKEKQERFTSIGKVLLRNKNTLYISDESLLHSPSSKNYTELYLLMTNECTSSLVGSTVLIKEALLEEDSLLIDNYAQLIPLCETSYTYQRLSSEDKVEVKLQQHVCLKNAISFLHIGSQVADIVSIQGEVESVNESGAFTWLQCSFCLQENLVQDSNLVIYCEDCSKIVPNPVLNVKLEVVVHCRMLASAKVHIQLLSATVKRILQISDGTCQPQCSVSDILGKEIGPLYCCVQKCHIECDKTVFYLSEVDTS